MDDKTLLNNRFNKKVFSLYQATSDDLMFWCWFDVLILSMNYGLNMKQISLVFSVSFWVALAAKMPGNHMAKKIGAGRCVMLSAVLFLAAALFLTFGKTLPVAIVGQSIYLIAMTFQEMATVIAKKAAARDPDHVDYMRIMSMSGTIHSVISLIAAAFMSKLYGINQNLPMYICVGFCINSCLLAFLVSRYDVEAPEEDRESRREVLPGSKMHRFDRTTISCLFLSILFMGIFTVSGDNLKILIQDTLSTVADEGRTVLLFSMILLASRLIKIVSNLLLFASRSKRAGQGRNFFFVVIGVVLISVLGLSSRWETGYYAIGLAVAAFMMRILVFDPFRFNIYNFMLNRLNDERMVDVLYVQSTGADICTALFSIASTVLLHLSGMDSVMIMLLIVSIIFVTGYFIIRRNLIRVNGNRSYLKWKQAETDSVDDVIVAAAALLLHYGLEQDLFYTPKRLAEKISSVEEINKANGEIEFEGYYDYDEDTLKRLFYEGHPCMIRAAADSGEPARWLPVMYMDDDGGVVWNPYSEEHFLVQFSGISRICCFTIINREHAG
ncbi:MAG: MFS transporter [Eubacterium sp.]|nr:MFS transporter [Eubacterium sp.]